ncbi:carbamate kinase [Nonomuraea rubra]|uniref:amino acid kinase family protein n=1 Tax=Nonomuraea rubra TaxID=46180 RepID=UPI0036139F98
MLIVVALGGNALLERGERPDAQVQREHVRAAALALAPLAAEHTLVLCHGNGPQIGMLAVESENDPALTHPFPLDTLGAQTQGMIGYWLALELGNAGLAGPVVTIVTRTEVDPDDPAFRAPAKFVGQTYPEPVARRLAGEHGWTVAGDGQGWRRVVASPAPRRIVELPTIRHLVAGGTTVICGGGGGVPVFAGDGGRYEGAQAVVDKDLTAALLAVELGADRLVVLTDVDAVRRDFGTPGSGRCPRWTPASCAPCASPPDRWRRRSRPASGSSPRPAGRRRSGRCGTRPRCSPARPGPPSRPAPGPSPAREPPWQPIGRPAYLRSGPCLYSPVGVVEQ